jgi:hypothetical protein
MAKQIETMPERKYRVFNPSGEGGSLFSSKRFPDGSFEKGNGRAPGHGDRKALFADKKFSRGGRFHIE